VALESQLDSEGLAGLVAEAVPASRARAAEVVETLSIEVAAASMPDVLRFLRDAPGLEFSLFIDGTAVDWEPLRGTVEVVYVLRALAGARCAVAVKTSLPAADPRMPSASAVFKGANWAEREIYDMFGVRFEGHPDLRRILMYEEFEGHPLRKSYPYQKRQPLVPERDPLENPWPRRY
jgi:NADH-quinone oxidoreductase subunit C